MQRFLVDGHPIDLGDGAAYAAPLGDLLVDGFYRRAFHVQ